MNQLRSQHQHRRKKQSRKEPVKDLKNRPRKVAILGGGMGALTPAFELTSPKDWKRRFDITIYQMGHQLGGKCASSRGLSDRIEEHGIHGFMGGYFNTLPDDGRAVRRIGSR